MCHIAQCFWAGVAQGRWTGRRMCVKEAVSQPENNKELKRLQVQGSVGSAFTPAGWAGAKGGGVSYWKSCCHLLNDGT